MTKHHKQVEIDPVLDALGPLSLFPLIQCLFYFVGYLTDAYQFFTYVFTGREVQHSCAPPTNGSDLIPELADIWDNSTSVQYGSCSIVVSRNITGNVVDKSYPCLFGMKYEGFKEMTLVSDFDLVCERTPLISLTQSMMSFGAGIGALIFPTLADIYGRKRIHIICQLLTLAVGIIGGVAPSIAVFTAVRFFTGIIQPGVGLTSVTASIEVVPSRYRVLMTSFWGTLFWSLCIISLTPIVYLLRFHSWRTIQMVVSGFSALCLLQFLILSEPLRWLSANGKTTEVLKVLKRSARWNKKNFEKIVAIYNNVTLNDEYASGQSKDGNNQENINGNVEQHTKEQVEQHANNHTEHVFGHTGGHINGHIEEHINGHIEEHINGHIEEHINGKLGISSFPITEDSVAMLQGQTQLKGEIPKKTEENKPLTYKDMFTHRLLRKNILIGMFMWFTNSLTYFAMYLMSASLAGNIYLSFALNALVETLSSIPMVLMLNRFGRKKSLSTFHTVVSIGLISSSVCFYFKAQTASSTLHVVGTVFSLFGKLGISASFNSICLYTPEIFPTNVRNRALGISAAASTLGGMVAPFTGVLANYASWIPGAVFGTFNMLIVILLIFLPESGGRELPQNIQDLEAWYEPKTNSGKSQKAAEEAT